MSATTDLSQNNAAQNAPQTPQLSDEEKTKQEQWQKLEAQLKAVQPALNEPMMDTFVRSANPERKLSILDIKTPV